MRKSTIGILIVIVVVIGIPIAFTTTTINNDHVVITYGETTYHNANYKNIVDKYFSNSTNSNLTNNTIKIITASDVNKISANITKKTYSSNEIFSSALLDLNGNSDLKIDVDKSKITTITPAMYKSALESAGITKGHVIITSPVKATGESALAGIMGCYELATNTTIPDDVKQAANNEIHTESEILNNSNISADDLAKLTDTVKKEVEKKNTTNHKEIVNIINNVTKDMGINLTASQVDKLADSIQQTQASQQNATNYENQISNTLNSKQSIIDQIFSFFNF